MLYVTVVISGEVGASLPLTEREIAVLEGLIAEHAIKHIGQEDREASMSMAAAGALHAMLGILAERKEERA